ncbi:MAG TPA: hypothetical protein VM096_08015, partial [Vicinamibacterales bacterium]|nr:hypothetical protein [Vicinamibacterales bacterium]
MSSLSMPRPWRDVVTRSVSAYGTPCYVTRAQPIEDALEELEQSHHGRLRQWLSVKTHPLPALIQWWARLGRGVEVVSELELAAALALGCSSSSLLVNGVAKHEWLPRYPIRNLRVHFDSTREVDALLPMAVAQGWRVGVRLHAPNERD